MRHTLIALSLLLAACGGDDKDPHAITTCSGWTDNSGNPINGDCEAACQVPPITNQETCDTTARLGCAEFVFSGENGCCIPENGIIKFYECVP